MVLKRKEYKVKKALVVVAATGEAAVLLCTTCMWFYADMLYVNVLCRIDNEIKMTHQLMFFYLFFLV